MFIVPSSFDLYHQPNIVSAGMKYSLRQEGKPEPVVTEEGNICRLAVSPLLYLFQRKFSSEL